MAEPDDLDAAVDAAAAELYGVALSAFTAERKRLADALRAGGAKKAAAAVGKLARPAMSAWVVNRLYRDARRDVDALFAAGALLRRGDRAGLDAQRAALATLRGRAAEVLVVDGHAASPATLQRVATTLQALAAIGTFAPDAPGRLLADRDPPGFEVAAGVPMAAAGVPMAAPPVVRAVAPAVASAVASGAPDRAAQAVAERLEAERQAAAAAEAARLAQLEAERIERERAAEKARRERAAAAAEQAIRQRTAEVAALQKNLDAALAVIDTLRERLRAAEAGLAEARARAAAAAEAAND